MRVFVLGAGASVEAGYPLAAEMGQWLATWVSTLPSDSQHRACLKQIAALYGGLDDFEAILADLMTCPPHSPAESLGARRSYVLSELKDALHDHFDTIRSGPAPRYQELARVLQDGDIVITFNYDLGVERDLSLAGLWNIWRGYGFPVGEGERSPVEVLKLHGSTNWCNHVFGGATGFSVGHVSSLGSRPVLYFKSDFEYVGYPEFVDPLCVGVPRAAILRAMIMPANPKRFYSPTTFGVELKEFWDYLWDRAGAVLRAADEVILIGYSMPKIDERARDLLLNTRNKAARLSISCRDGTAEIEQEFRDHGFTNIQAVDPTFQGFLRDDMTSPRTHRKADTLSRLNGIVGKNGYLVNIRVTFLAVDPAPSVGPETEIEDAITRSQFTVRLDDLAEGAETPVVSGFFISGINSPY